MTLTAAERDILNRIENKIDDLNGRLDLMSQRIAVVETKQTECPARQWSQPAIILAAGSMVIAIAVGVVEYFKG